MRWILEVGNTCVKWAGFESEGLRDASPVVLERALLQNLDVEVQLQSWWVRTEAEDQVLMTGSGDLRAWQVVLERIAGQIDFVVWLPGTSLPLPTEVHKPSSLGLDRVANAWAVIHGAATGVDPRRPWLVVDAGTCTTMDLVVHGRHLGGVIAPGLGMRLRSMADQTAQLPRINLPARGPVPSVGLSTEAAMLSGAIRGLEAELWGRWQELRQELPNIGVVLTGGDHHLLELHHISPKFADSELTLKGYHALFIHHLSHEGRLGPSLG
ncbi:MAG: type III pantothenate kinase [Bacteroidetes bacterium]|nr:type III pantothenate kinase [Bacteroidota bacterium]MDA0902959.1 type III pantothenate kinase [Bacteroidota bacterium]MDA1241625.1 type III pantothenate kinase [Bacteroidota bacterium]